MPLPLIKLGVLFFKQISKPITNAIVRYAKVSPTFRKICLFPANVYNVYEVQVKSRLLTGLGKGPKKEDIKPISTDEAVELGAAVMGEAVIYLLAVGILYWEYSYQPKKDEEKKYAERKSDLEILQNQLTDLSLNLASVEAQLREAQRTIGELDSSNRVLTEQVFSKGKKSTCTIS
ncbi:putative OPA3-like protein CG13603 [Dreissena polymorpha]|uniref:OPA3-like protein n=1 Tax=Dreissena polymorpha TaxID=45954 RepID=A0A9D4KY84_DREPO|nr:putative OPA3-like protein CG13603 [Dreissena polymorpha]KAH3848095.1 hypothetical protein DPMN_090444 [Dreissena polymorpha]